MDFLTTDPLLDNISRVEYVDHMGSDLSVVNAARVSFDKTSEWEDKHFANGREKGHLNVADGKLIRYLAKHNHWTPFGHAHMSIRVKAPIFVARQLVKHQVGLVWNEVSRRYVSTPPEFYWPAALNGAAANVKQGSTGTAHENSPSFIHAARRSITELAKLYDDMIEAGVAPEDARMFLPLNMYTEWVWSGSLAAWARVCKLRLDPHSQIHTRLFAEGIAKIAGHLFPASFEALTT